MHVRLREDEARKLVRMARESGLSEATVARCALRAFARRHDHDLEPGAIQPREASSARGLPTQAGVPIPASWEAPIRYLQRELDVPGVSTVFRYAIREADESVLPEVRLVRQVPRELRPAPEGEAWEAWGAASGPCGHHHDSEDEAARCAENDRGPCGDRRPVRVSREYVA